VRIALLAPVWYPVPPPRYGGIERVVALLADGLVGAGHDVTLFASGDSRTSAKLQSLFSSAQAGLIGMSSIEVAHALACYERADEFDVVNDHSGPPAAALGGTVETPVVHTVHGPLDGAQTLLYRLVARVAPRVGLVSLSLNQRRPAPDLPWIANCPNGIDLHAFPLRSRRDDYLLYLGRIHPGKGCHHAIAAARQARAPLRIAGKVHDRDEVAYFESAIRPELGKGIEFLGEVDDAERLELLQGARAVLFPIDREEPFGLVLLESAACGTPVVATRRGAVPEVVEDGRSGILVDHPNELAAALARADQLDAAESRRVVEERFSAKRMVCDYEAAYERAVAKVRM
jgi:glycosyltransferase involved in cell wall biosynthesis